MVPRDVLGGQVASVPCVLFIKVCSLFTRHFEIIHTGVENRPQGSENLDKKLRLINYSPLSLSVISYFDDHTKPGARLTPLLTMGSRLPGARSVQAVNYCKSTILNDV